MRGRVDDLEARGGGGGEERGGGREAGPLDGCQPRVEPVGPELLGVQGLGFMPIRTEKLYNFLSITLSLELSDTKVCAT